MKKNKEYKADYLKDYKEPVFEPELIAWINTPQLKQDIAIQT